MSLTVKCPTCEADVLWGPDAQFRPFCSERCRLIDLGAWACEEHRIADKSLQDKTLSEQELIELDELYAAQDNVFFKE